MAAVAMLSACAVATDAPPLPEVFGVTMVEETTCIGNGGRIVVAEEGAFCDL
ncbi:hypothetical protein [Pseudooctadecabacter jejudonensis]|uniref:hypothetical protein n=1 Tax=Pseudooctadecabacter jejudonensis TaxID=1391910 RepID=UPI00135637B2|nr:hypothetical protein [Pseudooctadecabacter jejudonensis]